MILDYGEMNDIIDRSRDMDDLIWVNVIKAELKYNFNLGDVQIAQVLDDMYQHCLIPCKVMN